ncbi:MAG: hypothetical protein WD048_07765 [Chitinophagales bacterium]
MEEKRTLSTKEKALKINLDQRIYGSFAEIGAGQDAAANFFKAGGASGTIAKTMSAYDMSFSDAIYGKSGRYVCQPRLQKMLDKEFSLLPVRLKERIEDTNFFAFANTVETLNFYRTNQGHGWLGCSFQLTPESRPNTCVIHVVLHDIENIRQQNALGILGVNLIYACYYFYQDPNAFLDSILDNINPGRVEVDMFSLEGPDFEHVDNRLMALKLVSKGLTNAAMFSSDGSVLQASEALYKKNILVLRGRFRPITKVNIDMLRKGMKQFLADPEVDEKKTVVMSELTTNALNASGEINEADFLDRVDLLCSQGETVMISNFKEFYKLSEFLGRFNRKRKIGIIVGVYALERIFDPQYYKNLSGGILESFGHLFGNNVKLYVYPAQELNGDKIFNLSNFKERLPESLQNLFEYLVGNDKLEKIKRVNKKLLPIFSDNVLKMIQTGEEGWEEFVPPKVATLIKDNCLFDYPCTLDQFDRARSNKRK